MRKRQIRIAAFIVSLDVARTQQSKKY